jgi:hypothetical protein
MTKPYYSFVILLPNSLPRDRAANKRRRTRPVGKAPKRQRFVDGQVPAAGDRGQDEQQQTQNTAVVKLIPLQDM